VKLNLVERFKLRKLIILLMIS